ncbi:hypothetical protein D1872_37240 [compost metagenome]
MNTKLIITKMPELINKKGERGKLPSGIKHLLENVFHDIHIQEIDSTNVEINIRYFELDGEPITNFIHEWLNYNKDTMDIMVTKQVLQMTHSIAQNNPEVEEIELINRVSYIKLSPLGYKKDDSITKKMDVDGKITEQKFATTHIKLKGIKVN